MCFYSYKLQHVCFAHDWYSVILIIKKMEKLYITTLINQEARIFLVCGGTSDLIMKSYGIVIEFYIKATEETCLLSLSDFICPPSSATFLQLLSFDSFPCIFLSCLLLPFVLLPFILSVFLS